MIVRDQHWTDAPRSGLRQRRRTICNWANYRTPRQPWRAAVPGIAESVGKPPDWSGIYDFARGQQSAALQAFFHDTSDPDNRAMVGVRLAM